MRIICKNTYWFKILFIGYMAYKNDQYIKFSDIIEFSEIFFLSYLLNYWSSIFVRKELKNTFIRLDLYLYLFLKRFLLYKTLI